MFKSWWSKFYTIWLLLIIAIILTVYGIHPESYLTFEERVTKHGYPVEVHQIFTEDDYILNLFRIPHGFHKSENENTNKSAILLSHGFTGSPHNFILLGKKDAPAYYFADRGFDVWIFCARGVECSNKRKHKKYDWDKDPEFWDYSFEDIGIYDQTACIDYIINTTGQKKIFFIGHSAGGLQFYSMISEKPEYNDKVKAIVNYATSPIFRRFDYPFVTFISSLTPLIRGIAKYMGVVEGLPPVIYKTITGIIKPMCADAKFKKSCRAAVWTISSRVSHLIEYETIEIGVSNYPPRFSMKLLVHFMDNIIQGEIKKYDWGPKKNMKVYGQKLPPKYNLSACTVPSAYFYGATDGWYVKEDIWESHDVMKNTLLIYEVGPKFSHLDFIMARNATQMVYEPTYQLFKDFDKGKTLPKVIRKKTGEDDF